MESDDVSGTAVVEVLEVLLVDDVLLDVLDDVLDDDVVAGVSLAL